jgi:hypothetical protein
MTALVAGRVIDWVVSKLQGSLTRSYIKVPDACDRPLLLMTCTFFPCPLMLFSSNSTRTEKLMTHVTMTVHAYNTHLGSLGLPMPNSRSPSGYSNSTTPNLVSDMVGQQATPFGYTVIPPIPPKSLASPSSRFPSHRLRVQPSLDPVCSAGFTIRACDRPHSTISDHDRSILQTTDSDEKGREKGRLVNSFSVGSLKSAYGTSGSEESDQTRVEGSVESDTSEIVGKACWGIWKGFSRMSCARGCKVLRHIPTNEGSFPAPPENSVPKRLLGFGWLNGMANRYRESRREKDFIDMGEERRGMKSSIPSSSASLFPGLGPPTAPARGREPKKVEEGIHYRVFLCLDDTGYPLHTPQVRSHTHIGIRIPHFAGTSSSDLETDMNMGNIVPLTPVRSPTRKLVKKRSCEYVSPNMWDS